MKRYDWLDIGEPDDYFKLEDFLDFEFAPKNVAKQLQEQIREEVKFILIEHDYVDKDYRSTFYNFYAKMGRQYSRDCVRLHFFAGGVNFDAELMRMTCPDGRLDDHYFGYIVLRPTINSTLGRSVLSPKIRDGVQGRAITSCHHVHLLGYKLSVWGFPSMAQHADISVCAHVSCWAILRHFSERYPQHKEYLLHEITTLAKSFDPGGIIPSLGLDVFEAERIFQAAGCYPLVVTKDPCQEAQFYMQLLAYLESGFPLFVAMKSIAHAVVVTGFAWRTVPMASSSNGDDHVWSQVESLLVVDDNLLPYGNIELQSRTTNENYSVEDFDAFIVPLPEKIYYAADAIGPLSAQVLYEMHQSLLGLTSENDVLRRYFISTISSLRNYARLNSSQLGEILVGLIMQLKTARFIWVVEYATRDQWERGHISSRSIVDATASPNDRQPVWLSHNDQSAIVFDRESAQAQAIAVDLNRPQYTPLARIERNLRPVGN